MYYEPRKGHGLKHDPFKALVVPRPIGWISTVDEKGTPNLAPYSFYNAVSSSPPVVVFGPGTRPGSTQWKDSHRNVERIGEFVVNLATYALREEMNQTSAPYPAGTDEFAKAGLAKLPSTRVRPPRVAASPVHLECLWMQTVKLPSLDPGAENFAVFGEVVAVHIADELIVDGRVEIGRARPIARLGYMDYCAVDDIFAIERPTRG